MNLLRLRRRGLILAVVAFLACQVFVVASDQPTLSKDQIKQFLLTAKVVKSTQSKKGVTNPWRLTLTDGTITHDASFQEVDERKINVQFGVGSEMNFVDSYKYNIAAYVLAELIGCTESSVLCSSRHRSLQYVFGDRAGAAQLLRGMPIRWQVEWRLLFWALGLGLLFPSTYPIFPTAG